MTIPGLENYVVPHDSAHADGLLGEVTATAYCQLRYHRPRQEAERP